jgi:hypothetical protein
MEKGKEKYIKETIYELKVINQFKLISQENNLFINVINDIIVEYILKL